MGQFLNISSDSSKSRRIPESLKTLEKKGFLKAFFSPKELRKLLEESGKLIISSEK